MKRAVPKVSKTQRTIPVVLDQHHLDLLGRVRYALGRDGMPTTTAAAVRMAIEFIADAVLKDAQAARKPA